MLSSKVRRSITSFIIEHPLTQPKSTEPDTKKEEDEEMDVEKFLKKLTGAQAYALLEKAIRHAVSLLEPDLQGMTGKRLLLIRKGVIL